MHGCVVDEKIIDSAQLGRTVYFLHGFVDLVSRNIFGVHAVTFVYFVFSVSVFYPIVSSIFILCFIIILIRISILVFLLDNIKILKILFYPYFLTFQQTNRLSHLISLLSIAFGQSVQILL